MTDSIPTTERLAQALRDAAAPGWMVDNARRGYYDDFKSELLTPCVQLVYDLLQEGLTKLAQKAKNGEFDATSEEADEWARSPEGQATMREFGIPTE